MRIITNILLLFLIFSSISSAQKLEPNKKLGTPIFIKNADSLVGTRGESGSQVREFSGNVVFEQGNVRVRSDRAFHYMTENKIELAGNVVVEQVKLKLKSPHIFYDGNTGIASADMGVFLDDGSVTLQANRGVYSTSTFVADFTGAVLLKDKKSTLTADTGRYNRQSAVADFFSNVKIEDDSADIYSDQLNFDRTTRNSFSTGNVYLQAKYSNIIMTADTLINLPIAHYTLALGKPVMFQIDTIKSKIKDSTSSLDTISFKFDTLTVAADSMEAFRDVGKNQYVFTSNVQIRRNSVASVANRAVFNKNSSEMILVGSPIVWYDSTQLHADSILISTPNNKLDRIHAFYDAIALTRADTLHLERIDQISGEQVLIVFSQDSIRNIFSYINAKSLYFSAQDKEENGAARNESDSIQINFDVGQPSEIIWLGAVKGEYLPESIFSVQASKHYLPLYKWSDARPEKKAFIRRKK